MSAAPDALPALAAGLQTPVDACLAHLPAGAAVAVAVSGGPDSLMLAVAAAHAARRQGRPLHLLHVHHGLLAEADAWAQGVAHLAQRLAAGLAVARVEVELRGRGVEDAARQARYAALSRLAGERGIRHVLLAQHADDQAETVLMRLLRGAGPAGMVGMRAELERDGVRYLRCWLEVPRAQIVAQLAAVSEALGVAPAADPTNHDARYARGHLRTRVLPAIAEHWPGYRETLVRHSRLAREAAEILAEVAAEDLARIEQSVPGQGPTLDLATWRALAPARGAQALRAWLAARGLPMPAENRLAAFLDQLRHARADRQVRLEHAGHTLRIYRNHLALLPQTAAPAGVGGASSEPLELRWQGEREIAVPAFGGALRFEPVVGGCDPAWLLAEPLQVGLRRGRERLRLHPDGPSRSLKNLFQERGVPAWERERLPLVWRGGVLVYVAGLGLDARVPRAENGWSLRWLAQSPGATAGLGE
ncbi:tRNA lysidine(34) synthetase TilS [Verticiella sediminum]|uniref:tRNA lysidine(34) synthetase TilS n=1 Tax=Verticiella sediminum TaxID=1247510 RepID=UPI001478C092|nr:tRNA lysidine(34) synthetase TilS [Verticiella sediminum]